MIVNDSSEVGTLTRKPSSVVHTLISFAGPGFIDSRSRFCQGLGFWARIMWQSYKCIEVDSSHCSGKTELLARVLPIMLHTFGVQVRCLVPYAAETRTQTSTRMCLCVCTYAVAFQLWICICVYAHTCMHAYICTNMRTYVAASGNTHMFVHSGQHDDAHVSVPGYVYLYLALCMHIQANVCVDVQAR